MPKTFTRKSITDMVEIGMAKNITLADYHTLPDLECVGLSFGCYGMNGGLFKDKDGNFYAVLARNTLLFQLV